MRFLTITTRLGTRLKIRPERIIQLTEEQGDSGPYTTLHLGMGHQIEVCGNMDDWEKLIIGEE